MNNTLVNRISELEDQNKILTKLLTYVCVELGLCDKVTEHLHGFEFGYGGLSFKPRIEKIEKILEIEKYKQTFIKE